MLNLDSPFGFSRRAAEYAEKVSKTEAFRPQMHTVTTEKMFTQLVGRVSASSRIFRKGRICQKRNAVATRRDPPDSRVSAALRENQLRTRRSASLPPRLSAGAKGIQVEFSFLFEKSDSF